MTNFNFYLDHSEGSIYMLVENGVIKEFAEGQKLSSVLNEKYVGFTLKEFKNVIYRYFTSQGVYFAVHNIKIANLKASLRAITYQINSCEEIINNPKKKPDKTLLEKLEVLNSSKSRLIDELNFTVDEVHFIHGINYEIKY